MNQEIINVQSKIINHLILNGKKETGRKVLLKALKELQKISKKQSKKLINLSIILSTPVFKIHKIVKKKKKKKIVEIPVIINSKKAKISLAIRFILSTLKKKKTSYFYTKLCDEVIFNIYNNGSSTQFKNNIQKQVLTRKHFFYYYR